MVMDALIVLTGPRVIARATYAVITTCGAVCIVPIAVGAADTGSATYRIAFASVLF